MPKNANQMDEKDFNASIRWFLTIYSIFFLYMGENG